MKIEFPVLESEPLIYFLLHSGVFVFALAAAFFLLGICMGATIWGRYKKQLQNMKLENAGQLQEIAVLKRKLAEQTMRPSTSPLNPPPALLTEVLPTVAEVFPERAAMTKTYAPPAVKAAPAPALSVAPPAALPEPAPPVPEIAVAPAETAPSPEKIKTGTMRRPAVRAKVKKEVVVAEAVTTSPVLTNGTVPHIEEDEVAPFGFLLSDPAEAASISALAAIIKAPPTEPKAAIAAPAHVHPAPTPVPAIPTVLPEFDSALGLVYKITPPETDDLTQIKGIASVLEKRLHELGIYTWGQIASWEESHIREFSSRLAFKDRIARERWVEQARTLNEERTLM